MIRPMQSTDAADLLALLHWMDDAPEREVFAPDARDPTELILECEDSRCLVMEDDAGDGVRAYCALSPFRDGLVLEGPVGDGGNLRALVSRAVQGAQGLPVYAFCARDNQGVRDALEAAGFAPMHTTDFYSAPLAPLARRAALPSGHTLRRTLPIAEYRALYRESEDTWANRLDWTPEEYDAHFARDDVRLLALMRGTHAVGFAELEFAPDAGRADVTYLAVHPAERGQRYGQLLLALAAAEAQTQPELRSLRVRAHDHMRPARALYTHAGLTHCRSVVTYMRDGDEDV
ncbi:GNAT family N-acetyltransferase [Deinococcus sp. KSM4-11]|uniref:GNAT family N-acetyltransferase n=1 Tax=Deinococcus sp. KSM4-11 TaxID=2568654 RepID=UPI0010A311DA|nr:GNAT family N-acetyltransferase [Deinococcus sp. KSM4-11]THF88942.1 GNAT family N-acetyltransferase [Deinococcus sp. KSM4-11]